MKPTFAYEEKAWRLGYRLVAGIDEVGRGAVAGPVVAAAVSLPPRKVLPWFGQIADSKKLTADKREALSAHIWEEAVTVGIGVVAANLSDEMGIIGIVGATKLAMKLAVDDLDLQPDYLLVDYLVLEDSDIGQQNITRGDNLSCSIAAASIVAKVYRDRIMSEQSIRYPEYGFERNKGYLTAEHLAALQVHGSCSIHRQNFRPIKGSL